MFNHSSLFKSWVAIYFCHEWGVAYQIVFKPSNIFSGLKQWNQNQFEVLTESWKWMNLWGRRATEPKQIIHHFRTIWQIYLRAFHKDEKQLSFFLSYHFLSFKALFILSNVSCEWVLICFLRVLDDFSLTLFRIIKQFSWFPYNFIFLIKKSSSQFDCSRIIWKRSQKFFLEKDCRN